MNKENTGFYYFRSSGTGPKSGGGFHSAEMAYQISQNYPVTIVSPHTEKNKEKYECLENIDEIRFYDTLDFSGINVLKYIYRSLRMMFPVGLKPYKQKTIYVASSHFLPDVFGIFFRPSSKSTKVVYIFHLLSEHRKLSPKTFISLFQEWLSLKLIKSCQAKIMVINQQTGQILEEKGFAKDQIFLTKCPVSSHEIKPVETKKKRYLLSFCGRMVAQKGIYDFLDVVENLAQNGYTEPSIMIGSGPEIDKLKKQASLRNLNIVFTGFVTETQKFTYLSLSKLFCFPSYEEGWGIVITEAFSVGIPVFAYKLPIYKEIFYPHIQTTDKGSITKLSESILDYLQTMQPTKVLTNGDTLVDFTKQFSSFTIAQNESRFILKG